VNEAPSTPAEVEAADNKGKKDGYSFKPKNKVKKENPWEKNQPKGNAGENWQPEGWTPGVVERRGG
jgi:NADH dehydrogenase [ubiquinone] 1 alpha subcomplex assembly factor 2